MIVIGLWWQWPLCGNWKCRQDYWSVDAKRGWDAPGCHLAKQQRVKTWNTSEQPWKRGKLHCERIGEWKWMSGSALVEAPKGRKTGNKKLRKIQGSAWKQEAKAKRSECGLDRNLWELDRCIRLWMKLMLQEKVRSKDIDEGNGWMGVNMRFSEMWMSSDVQISLKIRKW